MFDAAVRQLAATDVFHPRGRLDAPSGHVANLRLE